MCSDHLAVPHSTSTLSALGMVVVFPFLVSVNSLNRKSLSSGLSINYESLFKIQFRHTGTGLNITSPQVQLSLPTLQSWF
jgi:hypothetical protein